MWKRIGKCKRCGDCCRPETLPARLEVYKKRGMAAVIKMATCLYFIDDEPATCVIYTTRPLMCRLFPVHPADIEALPRCGYRFIKVETHRLPSQNA